MSYLSRKVQELGPLRGARNADHDYLASTGGGAFVHV